MVHVIFTVCVADKIDAEQQSEALAFIRYYAGKAPSNSKEAAQNLTMQHLVWETKTVQSGQRHSSQPSYGVMAVAASCSEPASVLTLRCGMLVRQRTFC